MFAFEIASLLLLGGDHRSGGNGKEEDLRRQLAIGVWQLASSVIAEVGNPTEGPSANCQLLMAKK